MVYAKRISIIITIYKIANCKYKNDIRNNIEKTSCMPINVSSVFDLSLVLEKKTRKLDDAEKHFSRQIITVGWP